MDSEVLDSLMSLMASTGIRYPIQWHAGLHRRSSGLWPERVDYSPGTTGSAAGAAAASVAIVPAGESAVFAMSLPDHCL